MVPETLSHYQILGKLGEGGMGEVYRARDTKLPREVAIKVLPPDLSSDPARRSRFEREAAVVAGLKHPNIVTIYSFEEDQGLQFITMELVEGQTLSELIPENGLPLETVLRIADSLSEALASAHAQGITHRDLKPANIMLDNDGRVKILDFGLAKLTATDDDYQSVTRERQTEEGQVLGTVAYMSPEQAQGKPVDHRSDVFSLGIVLYQMATGKHPFEGPTNVSTLSAILQDSPPSIVELKDSLPASLGDIVDRCLAKSPDARYQTTTDLREKIRELQPAATGGQTIARPKIAMVGSVLLVLSLALLAGAVWGYQRWAEVQWARNEAGPEIERLVDASAGIGGSGRWAAFELGRRAEKILPDDPLLARLRPRYSALLTIHSDPPGARVHAKPYAAPEEDWELLGETPIDEQRFVSGVLQIRVEKQGYEPVLDLYWNRFFLGDERGYVLREQGSVPDGMVWASDSGPQLYTPGAPAGLHMPGGEHLAPEELGDFFVDRYEVTNGEYKRFVDAGGYEDRALWIEPFVENDRTLTWEEAMARFTDRTGRAGPAMWEVGDFANGMEDYPVTGISWFEAAAYAEFAGKSLPTLYHWNRVALTWASSDIVPMSNLTRDGPAAVGSTTAMNRYGTYDLAGNAREWCANPDSRGGRFILGGGWNDPAYGFNDAFAQSPWDRSETNGFRCIQYVETSAPKEPITGTVELPFREFKSETLVSDETFAQFLRQYDYDDTPLNAAIELTTEEEDYVREKITFDAAYGGERMIAHLFLPKNGNPPYQTVVLFPGSGAIHARSSESISPGSSLYVLKSGRAFLRPVFKSTYERGDGLVLDYPDETNNWKEHVIMWGKDLRRSVDYLETREDIAVDKLAYLGVSWGAAVAPVMLTVEDRIKAGIVVVAGLNFQHALPEVDEIHYITRVKVPVLMLNGKYDFFFPYETSQLPYFEFLGTPDEHKKLVVHETGHSVPRTDQARESLEWLDRYLGPVH